MTLFSDRKGFYFRVTRDGIAIKCLVYIGFELQLFGPSFPRNFDERLILLLLLLL